MASGECLCPSFHHCCFALLAGDSSWQSNWTVLKWHSSFLCCIILVHFLMAIAFLDNLEQLGSGSVLILPQPASHSRDLPPWHLCLWETLPSFKRASAHGYVYYWNIYIYRYIHTTQWDSNNHCFNVFSLKTSI